MLSWIKDRLKEASTIKGIIIVLSAVGVQVSSTVVTAGVSAVLGILGLYEAIRKEK